MLKVALFLFWLPFLSGCLGFQVAGEVSRGRNQLMFGDPKVALAHFQRAAQLDPNYIMNFGVFQEGVRTYIGRAHYVTGNLPEARKALRAPSSRKGQPCGWMSGQGLACPTQESHDSLGSRPCSPR